MTARELKELDGLDWGDTARVQQESERLLRTLAEHKGRLAELLGEIDRTPGLLEKCERYDILEKLVLAEDRDAGVRLRLHIFLPGHIDRPHNHRWTYSSLILTGSYLHQIYGVDDELTEQTDVRGLRPLLIRRETPGSTYTLHHSMIHSLVAEPYTVSLILRGPAVKDRFLVMDKSTNRSWWQYGAAQGRDVVSEQPTMAGKSPMRPSDIAHCVQRLRELAVI